MQISILRSILFYLSLSTAAVVVSSTFNIETDADGKKTAKANGGRAVVFGPNTKTVTDIDQKQKGPTRMLAKAKTKMTEFGREVEVEVEVEAGNGKHRILSVDSKTQKPKAGKRMSLDLFE